MVAATAAAAVALAAVAVAAGGGSGGLRGLGALALRPTDGCYLLREGGDPDVGLQQQLVEAAEPVRRPCAVLRNTCILLDEGIVPAWAGTARERTCHVWSRPGATV